MLMEAVTLHRRFPYAVIAGLFLLDKDAETDLTARRRSTLANAHARLQLFTDRNDPAGREEQFERFYLILIDAAPDRVQLRPFAVGDPDTELSMAGILDDLLKLVVQRTPDFYEFENGRLRKAT
jgi:hypothetical protein